MDSGDNLVALDAIITSERIENFQSLGHTYSYPRSPLINFLVFKIAFYWIESHIIYGQNLEIVIIVRKGEEISKKS